MEFGDKLLPAVVSIIHLVLKLNHITIFCSDGGERDGDGR